MPETLLCRSQVSDLWRFRSDFSIGLGDSSELLWWISLGGRLDWLCESILRFHFVTYPSSSFWTMCTESLSVANRLSEHLESEVRSVCLMLLSVILKAEHSLELSRGFIYKLCRLQLFCRWLCVPEHPGLDGWVKQLLNVSVLVLLLWRANGLSSMVQRACMVFSAVGGYSSFPWSN